ncbi:hypothetical protein MIND_00294200 [Mycena indigotica]|uniref:Uncharacterized protein n=1 Tax=Mycena indigotica TaxID=2126181 RepID=A0A8H6W820_9AGAR|nr:uncharacterized protein MIND_00294200 [Mycena indigotica]KAF7309239.1 hypothetical protein MIND_00294200 [Mycena indigotica]
MKGISGLSRVTGREHDQISRFILGIIIDIPLPDGLSSGRLMGAVRGILDFVYLAQYPMHTDETLQLLNDSLRIFHENKDIFVQLGVRDSFNLPKLHGCSHYSPYIRLFGTTDNYNTEYTERLHIDLAKDAYRSTNFKDEFPQMTLWLERKEKVIRHAKFIRWKLDGCPPPPTPPKLNPGIVYEHTLLMAKHPTQKAVTFNTLSRHEDTTHLLSPAQIQSRAERLHLPFNRLPVYHRIKFTTPDPFTLGGPSDNIVDSVHVEPARSTNMGKIIPACFDTVLVNDGTGELTGTKGMLIISLYIS